MTKHDMIIIADYTHNEPLSFEEICDICHLQQPALVEYIQYDIIHPLSSNAALFDIVQLQRLQKALRLQRDLEMNLQGVAMVLDLLEELETLRKMR